MICSKCRAVQPDENFRFEPSRQRRRASCNSCETKRARDYRRNRKEHFRSYAKGRYVQSNRWAAHLARKYGIDENRYFEMLYEQGGACAICKNLFDDKLHVDHCHKTGRVRGLLCPPCNRLLGCARDDKTVLRSAMEYLDDA